MGLWGPTLRSIYLQRVELEWEVEDLKVGGRLVSWVQTGGDVNASGLPSYKARDD